MKSDLLEESFGWHYKTRNGRNEFCLNSRAIESQVRIGRSIKEKFETVKSLKI